MMINLTDRDLGVLRGLLMKEAKALGLGTTYHHGWEDLWPPRLKELLRVWRKIRSNNS